MRVFVLLTWIQVSLQIYKPFQFSWKASNCLFLLYFVEKESGHIINPLRPAHVAKEHTDIVKVVLCYESRVYSVG